MAEDNRPTREVVWLVDVDEEQPRQGQKVYALTLGGKLVEMIWNKNSRKDYHAWMPFPKIPKSVKEKLYNLYCNGGWRNEHAIKA